MIDDNQERGRYANEQIDPHIKKRVAAKHAGRKPNFAKPKKIECKKNGNKPHAQEQPITRTTEALYDQKRHTHQCIRQCGNRAEKQFSRARVAVR